MRPQDIKIGEHYRLRTSPDYSYVKAIQVLKGKEGENNNTYSVVKCEHTVNKNGVMGFIRYFRPCDLIKDTATGREVQYANM
jgi:hypothetical protein